MDFLTDSDEATYTTSSNAFSSEISLQVDSKSKFLGPAKEISGAAPRAESRSLGDLGLRTTITHVEHGRYHSMPAALIALKSRFLFDSTSASSRFTRAEIRMAFDAPQESKETRKEEKASLPSPSVACFCPVLIRGKPTRVAVSNTSEAKIEASLAPAAAAIVGVGVSGGYSVTERFEKDHEMTIKGMPWSIPNSDSSDDEVDNAVIWEIVENSAEGKGIPDEFNFAILVQHDGGPIQAVVETKVRTKAGIRLFGWPWPKPSPLIFKPGISLGSPLGSTFDDLRDSHWQTLAPYEGSFHVCLSDLGFKS